MNDEVQMHSDGAPFKGVPSAAVNASCCATRAINFSVAEVGRPSTEGFDYEFWQRVVCPVISGAGQGCDIPFESPERLADKAADRARECAERVSTLGVIQDEADTLLSESAAGEGRFAPVSAVIKEAMDARDLALSRITTDAQRQPLEVAEQYAAAVRMAANPMAEPAADKSGPTREQVATLQRFLQEQSRGGSDLVAPIIEERFLNGNRRNLIRWVNTNANRNARCLVANLHGERRSDWLDTAEHLEEMVRRRRMFLEGIEDELKSAAERAAALEASQAQGRTIWVPASSFAALRDRVAGSLQCRQADQLGPLFCKRLEARLNYEAGQAHLLEDSLELEAVMAILPSHRTAAIYRELLGEMLTGQVSIYKAIAGELEQYGTALVERSQMTVDFSGRQGVLSGIPVCSTGYLVLPTARDRRERELRDALVGMIARHVDRLKCINSDADRITLLVAHSRLVLTAATGLIAGRDAAALLGASHNPGLFGEAARGLPKLSTLGSSDPSAPAA